MEGDVTVVIYYSATGNSRHVALRMQETFHGDLIDVCDFEQPSSFCLEDEETLFFVTFNCFWGVSARMEAFIRENEFKNVSKIVAIITCGGYLGGADSSLEKLFLEKGLPKPTVYPLVMVTNYSVLHAVPPPEVQKKKLLRAEAALDTIISPARIRVSPLGTMAASLRRMQPIITCFGRLISHSFFPTAGALPGMGTSAMLTRPSPMGTKVAILSTKACCSIMPVMAVIAQTTLSIPIL